MQLSPQGSIRGSLALITAALLGSQAVQAAGGYKVESSILVYSETSRVKVLEGILGLSRLFKGDRLVNARFTFDGLTGASPNGATPSSSIQTFTRPSGNGSYEVKAGETPLDDTFADTRFAFDGGISQPLGRMSTLACGAHVSTEHDYLSIGANAGITRDFNERNTTLSLGASFSHDISRPMGGAPIPLTEMLPPDAGGGEEEDEDDSGPGENKEVFDGVLGLTQVLDRMSLVRLSYTFGHSTGYHNDPYKLISVVQDVDSVSSGEPVRYLYEARPNTRTKQAIFAQYRRYMGGHTIDLSYRYFWDDWKVASHTFELTYRLPLPSNHALQPHVRWYKQTEANFYHAFLIDGAPLTPHASADYRLAPFTATTFGLIYFFPVAKGAHISIGGEYYRQTGDLSPPQSMGLLSSHELFPNMKSMMVRTGFSYDF